MVLIGKHEFLFDIIYFFGNNSSNDYLSQEKDFDTEHSLIMLVDQVSLHRGDIIILTHFEKEVEKTLSAKGFRVDKDYFFFSTLKLAFEKIVVRQGYSLSETLDLWEIYKKIFYSDHGKYAPCHHPLYEAEITTNGDMYTCCSAIMPFSIGNIKYDTVKKIWHSPRAKLLRLSLINGTAIFCIPEKCGFLNPNLSSFDSKTDTAQLSDYPLIINIAVDSTCNLSCPSCRNCVSVEDDESVQLKGKWLADLDESFYKKVTDIYVAGNGECMFSKVYKKYLLEELSVKFNGTLHLLTNGQIWNDEIITKITEKFQPEILISIDAWKKETYEKLRRGGTYLKLIENVQKYIALKKQGKLSNVVARFVVQRDNYQEIPDFIVNMRKLGINRIELTRIVDGGTFFAENFEKKSLLDKNGDMKSEYTSFFAQYVWPILDTDVSADSAYLPK